jgi:two-component system, LuxR family, response regulator FixJ
VSDRVVYIVDDNDEFRESACFWLKGAGYAVKAWGDPREALDALASRPSHEDACLLLDVRMPHLSGLDLHDALAEHEVDIPIVYMSGHADVPLAVQAMQKGAVTVLEKPFDDDALGAAMERAFTSALRQGSGHVPRATAAHAAVAASQPSGDIELADVANFADPANAADHAEPADDEARREYLGREASLTPRELEVLTMVTQGTYNKVIADRIGLSVKTVELYRARGLAKMKVRTVAELTRLMVSRRV